MNDIAIQAQIITEDSCQFTVNRPLLEGSKYFDSHDAAEASPLAKKIFAIKNVDGVLISNNIVKVSKVGFEQWKPIAQQIGGLIREHVRSDVPTVDPAVMQQLPPADEIRAKVIELLQTQINPSIADHGGYVALHDVKRNDVYLQLGGGCQGCGMANMTLRSGVEKLIRAHIPEAGAVIDITDHSHGMNPYYK